MEDQELREAFEESPDVTALAARFNRHRRTVERRLTSLGLRVKGHTRMSRSELDWARECVREGMPVNWIAETLGRDPGYLRLILKPGRVEDGNEWYRVWHQIRKNSILLELHREFAPVSASKAAAAA